MNNIYLKTLMGTVILAAVLTILQIWTDIVGWDVYVKLIATLAIIFLLVGLVMAISSDFKNTKDLKDKNYLD